VEASWNIILLYAICSPKALCIFNEILNYVTSLKMAQLPGKKCISGMRYIPSLKTEPKLEMPFV